MNSAHKTRAGSTTGGTEKQLAGLVASTRALVKSLGPGAAQGHAWTLLRPEVYKIDWVFSLRPILDMYPLAQRLWEGELKDIWCK